MFTEMELNPSLIAALEAENITVPTDVQKAVIPQALKNKDIIAQSETGTGKTLAFLLPLFQKLNTSKKEMQALIMAPTHELVIQILRQIERLTENSDIKATSTSIIGNVNIDRQVEKLKEKPQIIVGSPGRILELIKKRKISAHTVKTIVIDEADKLMDKNNIEIIEAVIKSTMKDRQLMLFSATISKETIEKASKLMKEAEIISCSGGNTMPETIEHSYFIVEQRDKVEALRKLIRILNPQKAIVFVSSNGNDIDIIAEKLKFHGINAESIRGENKKLDRKKTMDDFRTGKLRILVSSDIAARGLHVEGITHIFNLYIPENIKDYLHRAGRTGRNGNPGFSISIITEREIPLVKMYEKAMNINVFPKGMYKGEIVNVKLRS